MARTRAPTPPAEAPPNPTFPVNAEVLAKREAEIRAKQDSAIARSTAKIVEEHTPKGLGTGFFGKAPEIATQAPAADRSIAPAEIKQSSEIVRAADRVVASLAPRFRNASDTSPSFVGETVTVTLGEENYGKPGSFSGYRVGSYTSTTTILPGETAITAGERRLAELRELRKVDRDKQHDEFTAHWDSKVRG